MSSGLSLSLTHTLTLFSLFFRSGIIHYWAVNLFAFDWASATISTETEYTAFLSSAIHATVGLHIGLHGINITLLGEPKHQVNQTIDYNENFPWSFAQGRLGFSPDDGSFFNVRFRAAQVRGTPLPILNVAEVQTLIAI